MKWTVYIVMVVVTFVYLMVGALVFHVLEHSNEVDARREFVYDHGKFLENFTCISPEALSQFVMQVLETQNRGVPVHRIMAKLAADNSSVAAREIEDLGTKWDIPSSVLFSVTVISTIGYGNMSPKTSHGQLFCIFFALIGIPMFAVVLMGTGERLQAPIKWIHRARPWLRSSKERDEQVKSIVFLTTGTLIIVFLPSLVFTVTQKWSYLESVYYTVITLTTIGFGDLVPGYFERPEEGKIKKRHVLYRVLLGLWILFGLSWGALILSEIGSLLQKKIVSATNRTHSGLKTLPAIVKKKKQSIDKTIRKVKEACPSRNGKDLSEVEMVTTDKTSLENSDPEDLKYEPTDSDY